MKMLRLITLLVFLLNFNVNAKEQIITGLKANQLFKGVSLIRFTDQSTLPNYLKFANGSFVPFNEINKWLKGNFKLSNNYDFVLTNKENDRLGFTHYRFKQSYNGVIVENSTLIIHVRNGLVESINGLAYNTINTNTAASITEANALQAALNKVGAITYKWQVPSQEAMLQHEQNNNSATFYPKATMAVYPSLNGFELCYVFNIYAHAPLSRTLQFVSAQTGQVIKTKNLLMDIDVPGVAITKYSGVQTIMTDSTATTNFRLQETGRGNGIKTYNCATTTNYTSTDFVDTDNNWNNVNANQDEVAADAHWGAEMTYDYYNIEHNRNSIDGNGFTLLSYVHYDVQYANAFWDGQRMTYGDGDATISPLTAIDVAGHEITHGVTENSSNLDYQDESGALNESFSDIFGKSIEHYARPNNFSWFIGLDLGQPFRDMADPTTMGDPGFYQGNNWYTGTADNGGVHTNSGVLNHWFYILTIGDTGVNEAANNYSVPALGFIKSAAIAYRTNCIYLTNTSQYSDARFYAILSAQDIYGGCSPEVEATTNAWYAVGLGGLYVPYALADFTADNTFSCTNPLLVNFQNLSINGSTYAWDFGDGSALNLTNNPGHTYNNAGAYNVTLYVNGGVCGLDTLQIDSFIVIDPNLSCVNLVSGTNINYSCTGILYDNGGPSANYTSNFDGTLTISPPGASSVALQFINFNTESGFDFLEIYDGPTTASPVLGTFDGTALPNGGSFIYSTSGSITINFNSDQGVTASGFALNWQCIAPPIPPVAAFTADNVTTCTGVVQFTDQSTNVPNAWAWTFGDGGTSTLKNPAHTYTANGSYTVSLIASNIFGADTLTQTNYITVSQPAPPTTTGASICIAGSLILSATPAAGGVLNWYASPTATTILGTGTSFTTPSIATTSTYYVEENIAGTALAVGPTDNTIGSGSYYVSNNFRYLIFDCNAPCTLSSVLAYANSAGVRNIQLQDNTGNVLQTYAANMIIGSNVLTLNFNIPVGSALRLVCVETGTANDLYRNSSGTAFPYTNGPISITGTNSVSTANYYYFYDWQIVQNCISPRVPAIATIGSGNAPATAAITGANNVCAPATVALTANTGGTSYQWNLNGSAISGATSQVYNASASGNYNVIVNITGCTSGSSVPVQVNIVPQPSAAFAAVQQGGGAVQFNDNSTGAVNWNWDFGNGITSVVQSPLHTYSVPGNFSVQLIVTNSNNCNDTMMQTVAVDFVGIDQNNSLQNLITVFPNPASDVINITTNVNNPILKIEMINALGQIVFEQKALSVSQYHFSLGNLPAAAYIIKTTTQQGITNKVITVE
jgi:Zn-dependent metalloprotease